MKIVQSSAFFLLLVLQCTRVLCSSDQGFDFFYFVQQWPASYCDTKRSCCYPTTGKPAEDFTIHGLWPNRDDGTWPQNCNSNTESTFEESKVSDLMSRMRKDWPSLACPSNDGVRFWRHEWEKHGTCSVLNQHEYFQTALELKAKSNLLRALTNAGIEPNDNGKLYDLQSIKEAIRKAVGFTPFVECNVNDDDENNNNKNNNNNNNGDRSLNHHHDRGHGHVQVYQVYLCVNSSSVTEFIECPILPHGRTCGSKVEFPSFTSRSRDEF